jgi:hypothetical protein
MDAERVELANRCKLFAYLIADDRIDECIPIAETDKSGKFTKPIPQNLRSELEVCMNALCDYFIIQHFNQETKHSS